MSGKLVGKSQSSSTEFLITTLPHCVMLVPIVTLISHKFPIHVWERDFLFLSHCGKLNFFCCVHEKESETVSAYLWIPVWNVMLILHVQYKSKGPSIFAYGFSQTDKFHLRVGGCVIAKRLSSWKSRKNTYTLKIQFSRSNIHSNNFHGLLWKSSLLWNIFTPS